MSEEQSLALSKQNPFSNLASSNRIALSILATLPKQLSALAENIKAAAVACESYETGKAPMHAAMHKTYNLVYSSARRANNVFETLNTGQVDQAQLAAVRAANLLNAINHACGDVFNVDQFNQTFRNPATLEATVDALLDCAQEIAATL